MWHRNCLSSGPYRNDTEVSRGWGEFQLSFHRIRLVLLTIFCVSLVAVFATLYFRSGGDTSGTKPAEQPLVTNADMAMQTVRLVENRGERTEWELEADSSETFQEENLTVLKNVRATFYPEEQPVIHVSGREGRLSMDTKDMIIRGDVTVQSESGYALKTEELRYNAEKKQVETDQAVEMAQEGLFVQGVGLTVNIDGKSLVVRRDVKATFQ